jgi:glycerol-3-phosphate cytidylyltransferase
MLDTLQRPLNSQSDCIKGFTCGTFDLFHAGHVLMLEECKRYCNHLEVGILFDPSVERESKNTPVQTILERQLQVSACRYVDSIFVYSTEAELQQYLLFANIDIRFLGQEYKDKNFTGRQICIDRGIKILYNERKHEYSSSNLRMRVETARDSIRNV